MFILQIILLVALLLALYVVYRALMQSQSRTARLLANVAGGVFAVCVLVLALVVRPLMFDSAVITSGSMHPTLETNDRVFVGKMAYKNHDPQFGEIITFRFPAVTSGAPEDILVKRVIGVPGDTIEVRGGGVYRNGRLLDEPYIAERIQYERALITVPQGKLLVLGDNRNESDDSHIWGLLDRSRVQSQVDFRFWPLTRMGSVQ